jgi:hypothetical protein
VLAAIATLGVLAAAARAAEPALAAPVDKGRRVFSAGHSFHMFVPGIMREIAVSAGIKDHVQTGTQGLGGATILRHWELAEEKNKAKEALTAGKTDVLTLSPIWHPDEGIDRFVELGLKHNPDLRVYLQAFWLPFDVYDRNYQKKRPEKRDRNAAGGEQLRKEYAPYLATVVEQAETLNKRHGRTVVFVVPAGQAVIGLREKIIAGQAPGIATQEDLFTDAIGHVKPPVQVLTAYCHFAAIYRRNPTGLPTPSALKKGGEAETVEKLNRLLQELAWEAVTALPAAGVKPAP